MGLWIESHLSLRLHPKRRKLSRALNASTAETIGLLHCLWWWAFEHAGDDGDISRWAPEDIADAAEYQGDPKALVTALTDAGFLDLDPLRIHDWPDYIGRLFDNREKARERMRKYRERSRNVRVTCGVVTTTPDLTRPNQTGPDPNPPVATSAAAKPLRPNQALVAHYVNEWTKHKGKGVEKPHVVDGRDYKLAQDLLKGYPLDKLQRCVTLYLTGSLCREDRYCQQKGWDFPTFAARLSGILADDAATAPTEEQKERAREFLRNPATLLKEV